MDGRLHAVFDGRLYGLGFIGRSAANASRFVGDDGLTVIDDAAMWSDEASWQAERMNNSSISTVLQVGSLASSGNKATLCLGM